MRRLPVLPGETFSGNGLECELLSQAIVQQGPAYTWHLAVRYRASRHEILVIVESCIRKGGHKSPAGVLVYTDAVSSQ